MELLRWLWLFLPGLAVYLLVRDVFRRLKKRHVLKRITRFSQDNFRQIATPIMQGKAAAVKKTDSGFDIHEFHWSLPSVLKARSDEELGTIILISSDMVESTFSYKENALLFRDKRNIKVYQVRWKVTLYDVVEENKSELGLFLGGPPESVEIPYDSNSPLLSIGEEPRQEVLKRLLQLPRKNVVSR